MGYTSSANSKARPCFACRFTAVTLPFYGGLIVVCFLITFLPKLYFSILIPHRKGVVDSLKKDAKKPLTALSSSPTLTLFSGIFPLYGGQPFCYVVVWFTLYSSLPEKLYAKKPFTAHPKMLLKTALLTKKLYAYNRKIAFAIAIPATFAQMSLRAAWQKFIAS